MVVFKEISDIKKNGKKYNKKDHIYYAHYIATREGAVYGEGMEHGLFGKYEDETRADNELYVKYIARRPGAMYTEGEQHGLFGKYDGGNESSVNGDVPDLDAAASYVGRMFEQGKVIRRCVISLTEEEAGQLGYLEREKWVKLLDTKMFDIAGEYNIKYENVEYVVSVHMEEGHPHLQFNLWDKSETIHQKILPQPQFERRMEKIRALLSKEIYKDNLHDILKDKEDAKKSTLGGFNAFMRGISQQELSASELDLKSIFAELCDEKMLNIKMDDKYVNKVFAGIENAKLSIKTEYSKGALKYKYLPRGCKTALDDLTDIVLEHSDFRRELNRYLYSVKEYSAALGNGKKTIAEEQHRALRGIYKSFGNRILNNLSADLRARGQKEYYGAVKDDAKGVDIVVNGAAGVANIFDNQIISLCNSKGVFHAEDIGDDKRLNWRISKLEKLGFISHFGMRYEVSPEFTSQVKNVVEDFKHNKLWGLDRSFIELKRFTPEELKAHEKNDTGKMEKRLSLLLAVRLVQPEGEGYAITKEYEELYKAQAERYKQSRFKKWFEENIDNDVKISIYDAELLRMAHDDVFTHSF